jgi:beta-galactosidase
MKNRNLFYVLSLSFILLAGCKSESARRETISLNGTWQIAEGKKDVIPPIFNHTIPVPGLVILAQPEFENAAPYVPDRYSPDKSPNLYYPQQDSLRDAYWYRRTVTISETVPEIALLKVGKAMFGTKVYVNGTFVGEHLPCFTPGYFDLKKFLEVGDNELVIAVGSCRNSLPQNVPDGFDYEKQRYISGIFDNVDLILSGSPFIRNVQVAPNTEKKEAGIQATLFNPGDAAKSKVTFIVKESKTGIVAGEFTTEKISFDKNSEKIVDAVITLNNCTFWSPETPFLYTLEVSTCSDNYSTRFGMRELKFDPVTHKAVLNGKPYFLRGTNITLYRFFEDTLCGNLPWNYDWVRKMHKKFKEDMFWNSYRNCIGFPPEEWYNIADEEGFMIQDEFPIWYGAPGWNKWIKKLDSENLAVEYREWMQERWNHPSVIVWDANNETLLTEPSIDSAIARVRSLDLSGRSWDNSYSTNRAPGDIFESHPYHYSDPEFKLKDMTKVSIVPAGNNAKNPGTNPVIINEYGWLWLNRNSNTTTLTKKLYDNLLGKNSTPEKRWELYAKYTAAETEFWRCHRQVAGVLHFTGLGYDRADGQTCDNWINVANLVWEPQFYKYVRDAFAPIGLMIDFWDETVRKGEKFSIPVTAINDFEKEWSGTANLKLLINGEVVQDKQVNILIGSYGKSDFSFTLDPVSKPGNYIIEVTLVATPFGNIKSIRNFKI